MSAFTNWLDRLIDEKGVDLDEHFEIQGKEMLNLMSYGVVVEAIKNTTAEEQKGIKNMLVKIDFVNGDIKHYFRHLAQALAF